MKWAQVQRKIRLLNITTISSPMPFMLSYCSTIVYICSEKYIFLLAEIWLNDIGSWNCGNCHNFRHGVFFPEFSYDAFTIVAIHAMMIPDQTAYYLFFFFINFLYIYIMSFFHGSTLKSSSMMLTSWNIFHLIFDPFYHILTIIHL